MLHCIGSLLRCDELLTMKHPDWSKNSRSSGRLCLDYSNPCSWKKDSLKLADIDISALWESGHLKARSDALEYGVLKSSDDSVESMVLLGCTLKKPKGKLIGVHEVEPDLSIDIDEPAVDEVDAPWNTPNSD